MSDPKLLMLGASNYTYAEATWTQTLPDWYLFVLTHESTHRPSPSAAEARFLLLAFALGRM